MEAAKRNKRSSHTSITDDDGLDRHHSSKSTTTSGNKKPRLDEEDDFLDFEFEGGENDENESTIDDILNVKKLLLSKTKKYPRTFCISCPVWDDDILEAFINLFEFCGEKKIMWETFVLNELGFAPCSHEYTQPLMKIANKHSLFKKIHFHGIAVDSNRNPGLGGGNCPDSKKECLLPNVNLNKRLESLKIFVQWSPYGEFTDGDLKALNQLLIKTKTLTELCIKWQLDFDKESLCEALSANGTLQTLVLGFDEYPLTDEELSNMIKALMGHPALKEVIVHASKIEDGANVGDLSLKAMQLLESESLGLGLNSPTCTVHYDAQAAFIEQPGYW